MLVITPLSSLSWPAPAPCTRSGDGLVPGNEAMKGSLCRNVHFKASPGPPSAHRALLSGDELWWVAGCPDDCSTLHHVVSPTSTKCAMRQSHCERVSVSPGVTGSFYPTKTLTEKLLTGSPSPSESPRAPDHWHCHLPQPSAPLLRVLSSSVHLEWRWLLWSFLTSTRWNVKGSKNI